MCVHVCLCIHAHACACECGCLCSLLELESHVGANRPASCEHWAPSLSPLLRAIHILTELSLQFPLPPLRIGFN